SGQKTPPQRFVHNAPHIRVEIQRFQCHIMRVGTINTGTSWKSALTRKTGNELHLTRGKLLRQSSLINLTRTLKKELARMIAEPRLLDQYTLSCLREADPVVQHYRAFFAHLDWTQIDEQDAARHKRGPRPHPKRAYIKAFLVGLCEGKPHRTQLRLFLLRHPWLVLELGFRPQTPTLQAACWPY